MNHRIVLLVGAMALSACVAGDNLGAPEESTDPLWELFKQSAIKISDSPERYVFGGDMIAVGEAGLRREYERYFGARLANPEGVGTASSPLTVDQSGGANILLETNYADSSGGRYNLTYCIQRNTFSAAQLAALEPALALAQDSWNGLV